MAQPDGRGGAQSVFMDSGPESAGRWILPSQPVSARSLRILRRWGPPQRCQQYDVGYEVLFPIMIL